MDFRSYMHIERYGNDEVQGVELGECYVFPKLDGTNASIWWNNGLQAGSRKRQLTLDDDNAGFYQWVMDNKEKFERYFEKHPTVRLYGEWLVPHSLRTYRQDAWRNFYVFDVYDESIEKYCAYDVYKPFLEEFSIDYVPPLCVMRNATYDALLTELKNNGFLIDDGNGYGEGIVIKNYTYQNRYGRLCYAKIVTNEFKEKHSKSQTTVKIMAQMAEQSICDKYVTPHLVNKTYAKIVNECEGWTSKYIPRLLNTVFYDLVNEEIWNAVKALKLPTINFKTLNTLTIIKIKELKPELF